MNTKSSSPYQTACAVVRRDLRTGLLDATDPPAGWWLPRGETAGPLSPRRGRAGSGPRCRRVPHGVLSCPS